MGRSERDKGARGEREFINRVKDELGDFFGDIDRNWNQREESRWDVLLDPWAVEIKRLKSKDGLPNAWREAVFQTQGTDWMPLVAYRLDHSRWQIQMAVSDMMYLMTGEGPDLRVAVPAGPPDWYHGIEYTTTMPIEAWFWFCREYVTPLSERRDA